MRILIVLILVIVQVNSVSAQERELAVSESRDVILTINSRFRCSSVAEVKITTPSAAYFDQGQEVVKKLSDTARAMLGFECPKVEKIEFVGITDGTEVYRADAQKKHKWALETYPPPLESAALFYSTLEPDFHYLPAFAISLENYIDVNGMTETYQYESYQEQLTRIFSIVDGDIEIFKAFIKKSWEQRSNIENIMPYYDAIIKAISTHAPDQFAAYNKAYMETFSALALPALIEENQFNVERILAASTKLIDKVASKEFQGLAEHHLEDWIKEEVAYYKDILSEAPLYEVTLAADFLASFPERPEDIKYLGHVKTPLQTIPKELMPLITQRVQALETLATDVIKESGESYSDAEIMFDTGFSLAQEFEEAGFHDESIRIRVATFDSIDELLKSNFAEYKKELKYLEFKEERVGTLEKSVLAFKELSSEFKGFAAYQKVTEEVLQDIKKISCEKLLKETGIRFKDYGQLIDVGDKREPLKFLDLACKLNEQKHRVVEFSKKGSGSFSMGIEDGNGAIDRFLLEPENNVLRAVKRLGSKKESPITPTEWQAHIISLIFPPTGIPDESGLRESDILAADPHDPKKLTKGVNFDSEDYNPENFNRALDACIAAVDNAPDDPRQKFQLGRVLWYVGETETANEYLKLAADANYPAALYYRAEILLSNSGDDNNAFIDALDMYERAGKMGYKPGSAMVKELNPDGIAFFKEIPPPTGRELILILKKRRNYKQAGELLGLLGAQVNMTIKNVRIIDSFQIAERTFSCEYKEILDCGMRSTGLFVKENDPLVGLMSKAFQYDCNNVGSSFGIFRKQKDGVWRYFVEPPPKKK